MEFMTQPPLRDSGNRRSYEDIIAEQSARRAAFRITPKVINDIEFIISNDNHKNNKKEPWHERYAAHQFAMSIFTASCGFAYMIYKCNKEGLLWLL